MSEVHSTTLEPEAVAAVSESDVVSEGVKIVSQMLGVSNAEVIQLANELESALTILDTCGNQPVICERLGGAEMTLSEAVNAIWPHTTKGAMLMEGISSVMAEIHKMLNSKKPEAEDEKDPLGADEEETETLLEAKTADKPQNNKTEAETQKEQLEQKSLPNNTALKNGTDKPAIIKLEKPASPKNESRLTRAKNVVDSTDNSVVDTVKTEINTAPKIQEALVKPAGGSIQPADKHEPKVAQEQAIFDGSEKPTGDIIASEINPKIDHTKPGRLEKITLDLDAELSQAEGHEGLPNIAEEPELIYSREGLEAYALAQLEFDETEVIVSEPLEVDAAATFLEAIEENQNPEQNNSTNLTIEEIEQPLVQLAEAIETSTPEMIEEINQILDKIIEVPRKTEIDGGVNTAGEVEAQKKLEELFIQLFDRMNIEYTDEQIESLACLTIHWGLVDELAELKAKERLEEEPQDRGTHEIIKKILAGISTIKKALLSAGSIGKSAVRLYNISNAKYLTSQVLIKL